MGSSIVDLDEIRHQHHLRHRGASNRRLAYLFWATIFTALLAQTTRRLSRWWIRRGRPHRPLRPSRQRKLLNRGIAFFAAISSLYFPRILGFNTFASFTTGRIGLITAYSCVISFLLVSVDAPALSSHFIDDVAFRAAWITIAQIPLVYLLATKRGPLQLLAGLSYERVNWMHRWIGRTILLSATTHMALMLQSISIADIINSSDSAMAVVRYGIGAYGSLAWIAVTSILPLRRWSYRFFYVNHYLSTLFFLWFAFKHVPTYARIPIYAALVFVILDKLSSWSMFLRHNVYMRPTRSRLSRFRRREARRSTVLGHSVKMSASTLDPSAASFTSSSIHEHSTTVIRICNVPFAWRPGQHVRLYLPALGPLEIHPFTPATCSELFSDSTRTESSFEDGQLLPTSTASSNEMVLMVRSHSGLTRRLSEYYARWLARPCPNSSCPSPSLTAYLDGPYGNPPAWDEYDNLVLIASSTGVSFALSVLDYLGQLWFEGHDLRTQKIRFIWIIRHVEPSFETAVTELLNRHTKLLRDAGIIVHADIYTTCARSGVFEDHLQQYDPFSHLRGPIRRQLSGKPPLHIRNPDDILRQYEEGFDSGSDSGTESPSVCSPVSLDSEGSSTLIDEDDIQPLADLPPFNHGVQRSRWWTWISNTLSGRSGSKLPCDCQIFQSQRRKTAALSACDNITRHHGLRPKLASIIASAVPPMERGKTMIATCANSVVTREVKVTVAGMNLEFAMRKRGGNIDTFAEGFS